MRRDDGKKPESGETEATRSPHERRSQRWKEWHVSRRVEERILKRRRERREHEDSFRGRKRSRTQ